MTDRTVFNLDGDEIIVEVEDTSDNFRWRMSVNGKVSPWTKHYSGLLLHEGYGVATAYWEGSIKEFIPFKIVYAEPSETLA